VVNSANLVNDFLLLTLRYKLAICVKVGRGNSVIRVNIRACGVRRLSVALFIAIFHYQLRTTASIHRL